jgi:uncharacterized protein YxjI
MSAKLSSPALPLSPLADWHEHVPTQQVSINVAANVYSKHADVYAFRSLDGSTVLQLGGKIDDHRDGRKFMDAEGKEIFTLIREHFHVHTRFTGDVPHGHSFEIKSEGIFGGRATFKNVADGRDVELKMKGNWKDREAHIMDGTLMQMVAKISPDPAARKKFFGKSNKASNCATKECNEALADCYKSYILTVASQVDVSLIAAFCIALDEIEDADGIHATHAGILS